MAVNEIEQILDNLEILLTSPLTSSQVAKLYGYVERFQYQSIDRLEGEHIKPFRKLSAKRCNSILDSLEQLNQTKSFTLTGVETSMKMIQLSDGIINEIALPTGSIMRFRSFLTEFGGNMSQYCLGIQSKLIEEGYLEGPSSVVEFIPGAMSITELQSIQQDFLSSDRLCSTRCILYHFHELAGDCLQNSAATQKYSNTCHILLSLNNDFLYFSIFEILPQSIQFRYHTSIPLSNGSSRQPVEILDAHIRRINLSSSQSFSVVWCIGHNREYLHQSVCPLLSSVKSLPLDSIEIISDYFLPYISSDALFSCPTHSISQSLSLYTLGIASTTSSGILGYIPFVEPSSVIPCSQVRRLRSHFTPHSTPMNSKDPIFIGINIVEKFDSKSFLLHPMSLQCPSSALSYNSNNSAGSIMVDVTVQFSSSREVVIFIDPLMGDDNQFAAVSSFDSRRLCSSLNPFSTLETCSNITTAVGDFILHPNPPPLPNESMVWVCEEVSAQYKQMGNNCMTSDDLLNAVDFYGAAIDSDLLNGVLYSNRSAAFTKLAQYSLALRDAEECVRLLPQWEKGWSRRGGILSRLGQLEESVQSYEKAHALAPNNTSVVQSLQEARDSLTLRHAKEAAFQAEKMEKERVAAAEAERSKKSSNSCLVS